MRTTTLATTAAALLLAAMVAAAVGSTAAAGMWHVKDTRESLANGVTHLRSVRKWTGSAKPPQDGWPTTVFVSIYNFCQQSLSLVNAQIAQGQLFVGPPSSVPSGGAGGWQVGEDPSTNTLDGYAAYQTTGGKILNTSFHLDSGYWSFGNNHPEFPLKRIYSIVGSSALFGFVLGDPFNATNTC